MVTRVAPLLAKVYVIRRERAESRKGRDWQSETGHMPREFVLHSHILI